MDFIMYFFVFFSQHKLPGCDVKCIKKSDLELRWGWQCFTVWINIMCISAWAYVKGKNTVSNVNCKYKRCVTVWFMEEEFMPLCVYTFGCSALLSRMPWCVCVCQCEEVARVSSMGRWARKLEVRVQKMNLLCSKPSLEGKQWNWEFDQYFWQRICLFVGVCEWGVSLKRKIMCLFVYNASKVRCYLWPFLFFFFV